MSTTSLKKTSENPSKNSNLQISRMANAVRVLAMDAVEKAGSGHPGMPMGMADVATVLFTQFLKFDPAHPNWPDRDRFVLSAGHGSMLQYALHYLVGYEDMTIDQLKNFRQLKSKTAGHPEFGHALGIETTTGPLGQGFANSVGMAIAEQILASRFGKEVVNHRTYALVGDGCLMEGIAQEALTFAAHLNLNKLVVLFDDNHISIDGPTSLSTSENQLRRFEAAGWNVQAADGHDIESIQRALMSIQNSDRPSLIAFRTTIAFGAPKKAGTSDSHGSPLGAEEIAGARKNLGWSDAPFEVPSDLLDAWRKAGSRGNAEFKAWQSRFKKLDSKLQSEFERCVDGELPASFASKISEFKEKLLNEKPKEASRKSSGRVLEVLTSIMPELIGGSADLTGSNLTKTSHTKPISKDNFSGSYIYYGIREHAMVAAMNGMALHGGVIPYGGSFFCFTDYCRPSIRLAALMGIRSIFVMTHDSIGLGEDGPTHQPVEHMASFRAMPNVQLMRPADAFETAECWELALAAKNTPSILVLSRQNLPFITREPREYKENRSSHGAYVISGAEKTPQVTLIATGSEVSVAVAAAATLNENGITTRVVSMPCSSRFDAMPAKYREQVIPASSLKVAIEAGVSFGWERYIGADGIFIGMESFGASAPAEKLYEHFGITPAAVVEKVLQKIKKG